MVLKYYNIMGLTSFMRSVVDRNVVPLILWAQWILILYF